MQKLIDAGYAVWKEQENSFFNKKFYQKTVRRDDIPLCKCNDALFLNVEEFTDFYELSASEGRTFGIFLTHQNNQGEWCNLKIYGLSEEEIENNLDNLEEKLLNMWKVFND